MAEKLEHATFSCNERATRHGRRVWIPELTPSKKLGAIVGNGSLADDGVSLLGEIEVPGLQLSGSWAFSADEGFELHLFPELSSFDYQIPGSDASAIDDVWHPLRQWSAYDLSWESNSILISWRIYGINSEHPMAMLSMEAASVTEAH